LSESERSAFVNAWLPAAEGGCLSAGAKREEKYSAIDAKTDSTGRDLALSKVFKACFSYGLPLYSQLFGVRPAGVFQIWLLQGVPEGGKAAP